MSALYGLSYGMFVVASKKGEKINGQISNTVFQVSNSPEIVAISINKKNFTHQFIDESGYFSVSILAEDAPVSLIGRFGFRSGRELDKFDGTEYKTVDYGLPVLMRYVKGYFVAKVISRTDASTHTVFLGEVLGGEVLDDAAVPMTYDYYRKRKSGKVPETAPTVKLG